MMDSAYKRHQKGAGPIADAVQGSEYIPLLPLP